MDEIFSDIKNKKVLITGATGGIGSAIATLFAKSGATVGIHFNKNKDRAQKLLEVIRPSAADADIFHGDLLDDNVKNTLVPSFIDRFKSIDVLINNAATAFGYKHFLELDQNSWDKTFDLNLKAPFCLMQNAFSFMKKKGQGRIVNISTIAVNYRLTTGGPNNIHYIASKAALDSLTVSFAREGANHNILVNSIRCGVIDTPMHENIEGYSKQRFEERAALVPLKHAGKPEDIAQMALFLVSKAGDFITGETIAVAGGD